MSGSQYFEPSPDVPSDPRTIRVSLPDGELHLQTDRGVFAHDALDTGTRVLLLGAPPPQRGEPLYAAKVDPSELRIDWSRPAVEIDRLVRLGGAWTSFRSKRIKVVAADLVGREPVDREPLDAEPGRLSAAGIVSCGTGALALRVVQPEGKAPMPFAAWANGARPQPDERFGS